jgi:hypothetical protein
MSLFKIGLKTKTRRMRVRRVSYLGLQLINRSDQKLIPAAKINWCHQLFV